MSAKTLSSIAEEYFYNINPLAQRIGEDVAATKEAYEGLWNTLSLAERNQAIDETIIQPEVALKYTVKKSDPGKDVAESYPKLRIQTGMKYVIDDTGSTLRWRDEHSAPFSPMTQSQMNLNIFDPNEDIQSKITSNYYISDSPHFSSPSKVTRDDDIIRNDNYNCTEASNQMNYDRSDGFVDIKKSANERDILLNSRGGETEKPESIFSKLIGKTSMLKIQNNLDKEDTECLVPQKNQLAKNCQITSHQNVDKNQMNINLTSSTKSKTNEIDESTALLETPSSYSSFQSSQLQDDGIPKTGFEFLDNW